MARPVPADAEREPYGHPADGEKTQAHNHHDGGGSHVSGQQTAERGEAQHPSEEHAQHTGNPEDDDSGDTRR